MGINQANCTCSDYHSCVSSRMHLHRLLEICPMSHRLLPWRNHIQTIHQLKRRFESVPTISQQIDNRPSRCWFARCCKLNRVGFLGCTRFVSLGVSSPKPQLVSSAFATTCTTQHKRVPCFNNYGGGHAVQLWTNSLCTFCVRKNDVDRQWSRLRRINSPIHRLGNGIRSREQIADWMQSRTSNPMTINQMVHEGVTSHE